MRMDVEHSKTMLWNIREDARKQKIKLPTSVRALQVGGKSHGWYLVTGRGMRSWEGWADNAFHARYLAIADFVKQAERTLAQLAAVREGGAE